MKKVFLFLIALTITTLNASSYIYKLEPCVEACNNSTTPSSPAPNPAAPITVNTFVFPTHIVNGYDYQPMPHNTGYYVSPTEHGSLDMGRKTIFEPLLTSGIAEDAEIRVTINEVKEDSVTLPSTTTFNGSPTDTWLTIDQEHQWVITYNDPTYSVQQIEVELTIEYRNRGQSTVLRTVVTRLMVIMT